MIKKNIVLISTLLLTVLAILYFCCFPLNRVVQKKMTLSKNAMYYPEKIEFYYENYNSNNSQSIVKMLEHFFADFKFKELNLKGKIFSFGYFDNNLVLTTKIGSQIDIEKILNVSVLKNLIEYKNVKIYNADKLYYFYEANNLVVSNNIAALKFAIDNKYSKPNLYNTDISIYLKLLPKQKSDTLILSNYSPLIGKINNSYPKKLLPIRLNDLFDYTIACTNVDSEKLIINSKTFLNTSTIKNKLKKTALFDILKAPSRKLNFDFNLAQTRLAVSFANFETFLKGYILLQNLDDNSKYSNLKSSLVETTGIDLEKKIMTLFRGDLTLLLLDVQEETLSPVIVLNNRENTLKLFTELVNLIPLQTSAVEISDYLYKGVELQEITSQNSEHSMCWAELTPDTLVIGNKNSLKYIINSIKDKDVIQPNQNNKIEKVHLRFNNHNFNDPYKSVDASVTTVNNYIDTTVQIRLRNENE